MKSLADSTVALSTSIKNRIGGGLGNPLTLFLVVACEVVKWLVILASIYLGAWQYCELTNILADHNETLSTATVNKYAMCTLGTETMGAFWGVFTGILCGISLLFYLPWRIVSVRLSFKHYMFREENWRPPIFNYTILAAVPSFTMILVATRTTARYYEFLDPYALTALQMVVMGLVVTEWTVKVQQEYFTIDLMAALAVDFFFAYDVIAFIMLATKTEVYHSGWIYPCFIFAVIALLKHIPTEPVSHYEDGVDSRGYVIHIIVSLLLNDIPFVIIRVSTMVLFNSFLISDMIFIMKNFFVIIFSGIRLSIIAYNGNRPAHKRIPGKRKFRGAEVWCDGDDGVCRMKVEADNHCNPSYNDSSEGYETKNPHDNKSDDGKSDVEIVKRITSEVDTIY